MQISPCEVVLDKAIKSHEALLDGNASEKVKQPYRERLEKIKQL